MRGILTDSLSLLKDILSSSNLSDRVKSQTLYSFIESALYNQGISQRMSVTAPSMPSPSSRQRWNPKPYQKRAIKLLLSQASVGLFLDPGLGKTSVCLAALKILKEKGMIRKALIIAPVRAIYNTWPDEIKKWEEFKDLSFTIVHGTHKAYNLGVQSDITLINPEGVEWLITHGSKDASATSANVVGNYDVLIVDESHRFKNSQTKRFKSLKPLLPGFGRRWILTGSPVPNGLEDLFGQIYILDLGRALGRFITHFRKEYFHLAGYNLYDWQPNPDAWEKVTEKISPLILQLSAEDYLQMPELVNLQSLVRLPHSVMQTYLSLENEFYGRLGGGEEFAVGGPAAAGIKLRQIANGFIYQNESALDIHDEKLQALESLLEEIGQKPVLILYEFQRDKERILEKIKGCEVLGGGASPVREQALIQGFNSGTVTRLAGHPGSMGVSLNLQGSCYHVVWYGIPWNLEHYDQAIARVWRQGQSSKHVYVHHIVARGTKDEEVMGVLKEKDRTQQGLLKALNTHRRENYGEE
jgi:SNF2 family DNA or RNA helicase